MGLRKDVVILVGKDREFLEQAIPMIRSAGLRPRSTDNISATFKRMKTAYIGALIVICEPNSGAWKTVLHEVSIPLGIPLIVTSRLVDDRLWSEVLNLGGYSVLGWPLHVDEVTRIALSATQLRRQLSHRMGHAT